MKADLYICSETFSHNGIDSIIDVTRKLSSFQMMLEKIAEHQDDNTLYVDQKDFVSIAIFNDGKSINDILSDYQTSIAVYGKDVLTLLFSIFKRCNNASVCLDDMKAYLDIEDDCDLTTQEKKYLTTQLLKHFPLLSQNPSLCSFFFFHL